MTTYRYIELHGEECWCYPDERPQIENRETTLSCFERIQDWQASRQVIRFAPGEFSKLMGHLYIPLNGYNITHLVQIKDSLAYFSPPVSEEESQDDLWDSFWMQWNTIPGRSSDAREVLKSKFHITRK
jgi:hypothetical protein